MAAARESNWLDVAFVFLTVGPFAGGSAAFALSAGLFVGPGFESQALDAALMIVLVGYTVGLVPAAATGALMGVVSPALKGPVSWIIASAVAGAAVCGLGALFGLLLIEFSVNGSQRVAGSIVSEGRLIAVLATIGAVEGFGAAVGSLGRRPGVGGAPKTAPIGDPLALGGVGL